MFKRLRNFWFGLTKDELRLMDTEVAIALWKIQGNKTQLKYAKKAIWLLEVED